MSEIVALPPLIAVANPFDVELLTVATDVLLEPQLGLEVISKYVVTPLQSCCAALDVNWQVAPGSKLPLTGLTLTPAKLAGQKQVWQS